MKKLYPYISLKNLLLVFKFNWSNVRALYHSNKLTYVSHSINPGNHYVNTCRSFYFIYGLLTIEAWYYR